MTPDDIAEVVVFSATRRENVVIADTLIFPQHQVSAPPIGNPAESRERERGAANIDAGLARADVQEVSLTRGETGPWAGEALMGNHLFCTMATGTQTATVGNTAQLKSRGGVHGEVSEKKKVSYAQKKRRK